jgi:hypothetical protein
MAKKRAKDPFAPLRAAETNGENYDVSTSDIIARFKKWQKLCSFRLTKVESDTVTLKFETLPKNIKAFIKDAYDLCPDLVQIDEDVDFPLLERRMLKDKTLMLWWD